MSRDTRKRVFKFPTRSDTVWSVLKQKKARSWKFCIKIVEELYKPYSENKGTVALFFFWQRQKSGIWYPISFAPETPLTNMVS